MLKGGLWRVRFQDLEAAAAAAVAMTLRTTNLHSSFFLSRWGLRGKISPICLDVHLRKGKLWLHIFRGKNDSPLILERKVLKKDKTKAYLSYETHMRPYTALFLLKK